MHSKLGFAVRHLMITDVCGVFAKLNGAFSVDHDATARSSLTIDIEVASVDTGNSGRNEHPRAIKPQQPSVDRNSA